MWDVGGWFKGTDAAVNNYHTCILQWAKENGCFLLTQESWICAAEHGHLHLMEWAHANGYF